MLNLHIGAEYVVPFSSRSRSLALKLSTSFSENIILWVKTLPYFTYLHFTWLWHFNVSNCQVKVIKWHLFCSKRGIGWNMAMFSLKEWCFHGRKLTTWERENERTKEPQIPRLRPNAVAFGRCLENHNDVPAHVQIAQNEFYIQSVHILLRLYILTRKPLQSFILP